MSEPLAPWRESSAPATVTLRSPDPYSLVDNENERGKREQLEESNGKKVSALHYSNDGCHEEAHNGDCHPGHVRFWNVGPRWDRRDCEEKRRGKRGTL